MPPAACNCLCQLHLVIPLQGLIHHDQDLSVQSQGFKDGASSWGTMKKKGGFALMMGFTRNGQQVAGVPFHEHSGPRLSRASKRAGTLLLMDGVRANAEQLTCVADDKVCAGHVTDKGRLQPVHRGRHPGRHHCDLHDDAPPVPTFSHPAKMPSMNQGVRGTRTTQRNARAFGLSCGVLHNTAA